MFATEFLDRLDALSNRSRHPVAPRFVGVFESPLRHHALDRRHRAILPSVPTVIRRHPAHIARPESLTKSAPTGQTALVTGIEDLLIRDAVVDDANAMSRLHVRAWQSAYRGVMPDEYLDGLQADDRIEMWRGIIAEANRRPPLVAVVADDVVGFAAFGEERSSTSAQGCGELYAVNLDPDHWGRGIGRVLLQQVTRALAAMGYREAVLWVVPQNVRARALYESEGWVEDGGVSSEEILGVNVTDIRYRRPLVAL